MENRQVVVEDAEATQARPHSRVDTFWLGTERVHVLSRADKIVAFASWNDLAVEGRSRQRTDRAR
jgi:hypothetical protein